MQCDRIWRNAHLATLAGEGLGIVTDGVIAARDGRIVFAGPTAEAPELAGGETIDCGGRWITPGLIDCHTHLVYAGDRAEEFERRLNGESYEAIARAGSGILTTVKATRAADVETLTAAALPRLDALLAEGVTTVEIKTGYGLSLEAELKQLAAARALAARRPVRVVTTLLAAHTTPPEYRDDPDRYIDLVCEEILPAAAAAGVDQVDAFCETIAFSPAQVRRVFEAARRYGLPVKLHADQLSDSGGAALAAEFGALSADHLEHLDAAGAAVLARAGVTAVLLPGAFYFTREDRRPPVDLLRAHAVPMAVASDCNPGTSPLTSLLLAMNMAATLFRLTVAECLAGTTRNAARALGLTDVGTLEPGRRCDLAIWDIERPAELVYRIGFNPLQARILEGRDA